ncbi:outer membrane protein W [Pectobacterium atrosepticum SCRI1043]|uniref:Outer membrane protein W n=1 Tax=Pectobacterium atrosepticum (strain SCRI 1043 / ATCC BAA-672) TaxID=218491 RepID=Q6D4T7_PECAS|nr:outer membrane protein OmpW [Pectobacterium atrosepticum]GKV85351.1 outer membrane protein OmpW [Pectobacterium carotovorum subsp. carotovorum]AIA71113.1 membrane protein [Pectobacterium atrosepticum]AIK14063.1 outer membrane protein W [Pectobacterium atrosepticum]ATY90883.1 outer membrane protein OmpW [Pectobacterium atrosepticum]KFX14103.1 membrane protein [Pectobacterium atrosepticum]
MKKASFLLLAAALMPALAQAHQEGDFIVRAGSATVRPSESSDNVLGSLGSFQVNNNTQLGLTFSYMVTDNIGVELLAATPFNHNVGLRSTGTIAEVKHLPPSLVAQYYFGDKEDTLRPYLGVGVNYTLFFDEKFNDTGTNAGLSDLSLKNSWGIAAQAGLDYNLDKNWLLNMSVWWMDIDTDVKFKAGNDQQSVHTRLDPWAFMFGVGYRF